LSARAQASVGSLWVNDGMQRLNDVHSRLNPTTVTRLVRPRSVDEVVSAVRGAAARDMPVSVCGGRHAMGGQQFVTGGLQLDLSRLDRLTELRPGRRLATMQAGIQWPRLLAELHDRQAGNADPVTFRQKQTGADRLSIGGALSANIHGRGLQFGPFVEDVDSFTLVDASGELRRCSRTENTDLFRLVVGGYGLFGIVVDVTLRLVPRIKLRRHVTVTTLAEAEASFDERVAQGYAYGDFQFATDPASPDFLRRGVLSTYLPVGDDVPVTRSPVMLRTDQWQRLLRLAHTDRTHAFEVYANHYLTTNGQVYWSDRHQLGVYVDGYHDNVDTAGSEMITEVFVPRDRLVDFLAACRDDFRAHDVALIYGTVRAIRRDRETFLPWAVGDHACVVFNLCVRHDEAGLAKARKDFRRIIDRALERGGTFYLTYHRWATPEQLLAGHPRFLDYLRAKLAADPEERFQSDWYRHWRRLLDS
jgi:FAD/FMN-containing dehydrogenase